MLFLALLKAINIWHTTGLLVPEEDFVFQDHVNHRFHCVVWDWWTVYHFPDEMRKPTPPSVYYFSYKIRSAMGIDLAFWDYVARV